MGRGAYRWYLRQATAQGKSGAGPCRWKTRRVWAALADGGRRGPAPPRVVAAEAASRADQGSMQDVEGDQRTYWWLLSDE